MSECESGLGLRRGAAFACVLWQSVMLALRLFAVTETGPKFVATRPRPFSLLP